MLDGRRREQTVDDRYWIGHRDPRPTLRNAGGHRQDAIRVLIEEAVEPGFERCGRDRVSSPYEFNAASKLADHEHGEPEFVRDVGSHPSTDAGVRSRGLPQLRNDVRVEQKAVHRST